MLRSPMIWTPNLSPTISVPRVTIRLNPESQIAASDRVASGSLGRLPAHDGFRIGARVYAGNAHEVIIGDAHLIARDVIVHTNEQRHAELDTGTRGRFCGRLADAPLALPALGMTPLCAALLRRR